MGEGKVLPIITISGRARVQSLLNPMPLEGEHGENL